MIRLQAGGQAKVRASDNRLFALSAKAIEAIPAGGMGFDGGGLVVRKHETDKTRGKWLFRYSLGGSRFGMGLGAWPAISLAMARQIAQVARDDVAASVDPKRARDRRAKEAAVRPMTFAECACDYVANPKRKLRDGGKAGRWMSPIDLYAIPAIGNLPVGEITPDDVVRVLRPIWKVKFPTADKLAGRIALVLEHAGEVHGIATDRNAVSTARRRLGDSGHKVENIEATPWENVPALFARLDLAKYGIAAALTRFAILVAGSRMAELRLARWEHFDSDNQTLFVPASKRGHARRHPLSPQALAVIEFCQSIRRNEWIFPNERGPNCAHMNTVNNLLDKLGEAGRAHGFRASFKRWSIAVGADQVMAEIVADHAIGNAVAASYSRTTSASAIDRDEDFLDQRRKLVAQWCEYVAGCG